MAHCISGGGKFRSSAAMQPTDANDYNEGASNDDRDFSNDNGDDGSNANGAEMDVEIIPWRVAGPRQVRRMPPDLQQGLRCSTQRTPNWLGDLSGR